MHGTLKKFEYHVVNTTPTKGTLCLFSGYPYDFNCFFGDFIEREIVLVISDKKWMWRSIIKRFVKSQYGNMILVFAKNKLFFVPYFTSGLPDAPCPGRISVLSRLCPAAVPRDRRDTEGMVVKRFIVHFQCCPADLQKGRTAGCQPA